MFLVASILIYPHSVIQAAEGDFSWAQGFGQSGQNSDDIGFDVFVDAAGNVYMTGYFRGTVDFDSGPGTVELISVGNSRDVFITKMDSSGALVWAKALRGSSSNEGYGIFVDSSGYVYTTGYFGDTVDFDPGVGTQNRISNGAADIFISKLDSNGDFVDVWTMGGNNNDTGFGIFLDPSGNIYTTGYFGFTVDFDPDPAPGSSTTLTSEGLDDIFISKLNSDGSFAWVRSIGGTAFDVGLGLSLYSSGNIYITGYYQDTVVFNPGAGATNLTSAGSYDIFVSKLDSNGTLAWAKSMGGVSDDRGQAVSTDASGNVYTTGWFNGTADFDPGAGTSNLASAGSADIFISKLDSNGNYVWARSMGGSSSADAGYGIFANAAGNIYTTGSFQGMNVDFNPGVGTFNLSSAGDEDIFISKLDSGGNFVWAKSMGGISLDRGYDIFVDSTGAVLTTGFFRGTADFDPGPGTFNLISAGFEDIFISKLSGRDVGGDVFPWNLFLPAIIGNPVQ